MFWNFDPWRFKIFACKYKNREVTKALSTLHFYLQVKLTATCDPELLLISKLYILYNALFKNESTFGQNLLAIKYENLTATKKYLYLFGCSLGYAKQRIERQKLSSWLHDLIFHLDTFFKVYSLWNISCFLLYGEKPRLIERILGLNQTYAYDSAQRTFNSKYLARELLWNGFIVRALRWNLSKYWTLCFRKYLFIFSP